jgi:hypothetical protein
MRFFVRCLLWILMAALPLQGGAAVFAACKAQEVPARGCHEQAVTPTADSGKDSFKTHGKCSTCASCCTAATAPPLALDLPAPCPRPARARAPAEAAIAAVFPAVPERPPRALS